ncbi:hypothetical protein KIN20_025389 [Parelaphostrongylus tenuis]|uniref:C-type lectin domain-containing protein n=1 Tax=Parelaphostrongylus tenuis TaxID=148309 RepID=A0AAD5NDC3_PARTN|nr:hypothetical protein KIN20_025389 [Parelaphostrongylus tenuis]
MDAFVPYLRADDVRQKQIAQRIDQFTQQYVTDPERFDLFGLRSDTVVWISSVSIPSTQCAWLSTRTGRIGTQNCNNLMPFVCEKGTQPYVEPVLWRAGIVIAVIIVSLLLVVLFLLALCWCIKSRRRTEDNIERKNIIRASLKLQRKASAQRQREQLPSHQSVKASLTSSTINAYDDPFIAHKNMLRGRTACSRSPTETVHTECSDSLSTDRVYDRLTSDTSRGTSSYSSFSRPKSRHDVASDGYYAEKVLMKQKVSSNPNPYEEIPTMNTFHSTNKINDGVCLRDDRTYTSCSTCPTESERDSTLTDGSWSEQSSSVSDSTVQNRRLLPLKPEPPPRYDPYPPRLIRNRSNPNLETFQDTNHHPSGIPAQVPLRNMLSTSQRSLVHLHNPSQIDAFRRTGNGVNSTRPVIETAM